MSPIWVIFTQIKPIVSEKIIILILPIRDLVAHKNKKKLVLPP